MSFTFVISAALPFFFFFNYTATTEIYTLSLHDALPISRTHASRSAPRKAAHTFVLRQVVRGRPLLQVAPGQCRGHELREQVGRARERRHTQLDHCRRE